MATTPRWKRPSIAQPLCRVFFQHYLPHVVRHIDEFLIKGPLPTYSTRRVSKELQCRISTSSPRDPLPRGRRWSSLQPKGHMHVFEWMAQLQARHGPWSGDYWSSWKEAAKCGHLEVVKWMYVRKVQYGNGNTEQAMKRAPANGHYEVVKFLYKHYPDCYVANPVGRAANNGHLEVVQLLCGRLSLSRLCIPSRRTGFAQSRDPPRAALSKTEAEYSRFLPSHSSTWNWPLEAAQPITNSKLCRYAAMDTAASGNLPMLTWLHEEVHTPRRKPF